MKYKLNFTGMLGPVNRMCVHRKTKTEAQLIKALNVRVGSGGAVDLSNLSDCYIGEIAYL